MVLAKDSHSQTAIGTFGDFQNWKRSRSCSRI